jgi:hypothetical protein
MQPTSVCEVDIISISLLLYTAEDLCNHKCISEGQEMGDNIKMDLRSEMSQVHVQWQTLY